MSNFYGNINGNVIGNVTGNVIGNVSGDPSGNMLITGNVSIFGKEAIINCPINIDNNLHIDGDNTNISGALTTINNIIKNNLNITGTLNTDLYGNISNSIFDVSGNIYADINNNTLNNLSLNDNFKLLSNKDIKCNKITTILPTDTLTLLDASGNLSLLGNTYIAGTLDVMNLNVNTNMFTVDTSGNTYTPGVIIVKDDLSVNTNKFKVDHLSGNTNIMGTLSINNNIVVNTNKFSVMGTTGNTNIGGTLDIMNDTSVNTNKFTISSVTGNTNIMGALSVIGNINVNTDKFNINAMTGNTNVAGTLDVMNNININNNTGNQQFNVNSMTGNTAINGTLNVMNDIIVNTDKFKVTATTGNTNIAGTLGVMNDFAINTNKFIVASATGNTNIAGSFDINGNMNVNTNKLNVIAATGNTTIAGTLGVSGNMKINTNTAQQFIVDTSGNTTISGTLDIASDITVNTNKFIVDTNGNTSIAGNLDVSGNSITKNFTSYGVTNLNGSIINIGTNGSTVNIMGSTNMIQTTDLQINDKLVTLNKGGLVASAGGAGIEFEENNNITSYIKIANNRSSYDVKLPNNNNIYTMLVKDASGNMDISGNLTINQQFNIMGSTGNTTIAGILGVNDDININANKFKVTAISGNTLIAGTLDVSGNTNIIGPTTINGNIAIINDMKQQFIVNSMTGNTLIGGTLNVGGNTNINGIFGISNGMTVNTNKFTVATTGNTNIAGDLTVMNNTNINGNINITGTTTLNGNINLTNTTINGPLVLNNIANNNATNIVYYNTLTGNLSYGLAPISGMKFTKSSTQPTSGTNGDEWLSTTNTAINKLINGSWYRITYSVGLLIYPYINTLNSWFSAKSFILLYQGSTDGFLNSTFHSKCDNIGPTIVVIKTTSNTIIGGYVTISWNGSKYNYMPDPTAFLFNLTSGTKYPVATITGINATYMHIGYGPTFGGGHDLYTSIDNKTGTCNTSSYTSGILGGSTSFNIAEIEVYRLTGSRLIDPYIPALNGMDVTLFNLLYRGSRDGFANSIFHSKCDNMGPTIVVVKTTTNIVIGGYISVSWNSSSSWVPDENAFLFNLTIVGKYPIIPASKVNATYMAPTYGPTFGGGHDLYIQLDAKSGGTNPNSYTSPSLGNITFNVDEIEVYQVNTIVSTTLITPYMSTLNSWLPNKSYSLLYRGTRDGFSNSMFHSKCDNMGATIVVIKTSSNSIIGGYLSISWNSTSKYTVDSNAFLFNLPNGTRYLVQLTIYSAYMLDTYGPVYGNGHDLYTNLDNSTGYTNPYAYTSNDGPLGPNNTPFNISEIEVYKVT